MSSKAGYREQLSTILGRKHHLGELSYLPFHPVQNSESWVAELQEMGVLNTDLITPTGTRGKGEQEMHGGTVILPQMQMGCSGSSDVTTGI